MNIQDIKSFIEKNKTRHLSNKVLHAHPSPIMWKESFADEQLLLLTNTTAKTKSVNMYLGIPYCIPTNPPHCGFCLFPTQDYKGKKELDFYLEYLMREAILYKDFYSNTNIESLYVGGGTPNLLNAKDYEKLISIIDFLFPTIDNNIEKTLEGIPQLFNEEKIKAIKGSGFNRVSMGVQQVTDKLIATSGRKQTQKQVFDAIDLFHKYELSCNIDLIYGWPKQTIDDMLYDPDVIVKSGIKHITHYELNIAGRSDFSTKQKQLVPNIDQKIKMYNVAKEFLLSSGYTQRTVYDWEKIDNNMLISEKYLYENNLRDWVNEDIKNTNLSSMGGIGYSAINMRMQPLNSEINSISAMNHRNLKKYYDSIDEGKIPIERIFIHDDEDVKLVWIFQSLQEMKINTKKYRSIFNEDIFDKYHDIWNVLLDYNWVKITDEFIYLIDDGEFFTPLIQSLLSQSRLNELTLKRQSNENK